MITITFSISLLFACVIDEKPAATSLPASRQKSEVKPHTHIALGDKMGTEAWPLTFDLPQSIKDAYPQFAPKLEKRRQKEGKLAVMAWTPPKVQRIRATLLIMENTDSLEFGAYESVRRVAEKQQMGIVYLRFGQFVHEYLQHEPRDITSIQAILDEIANRTGINEYRHAPWIPFGKSSVGRFPAYMSWAHPDRVIAGIVWHGEVPPWSEKLPPAWAKLDQSILYLNVNGESEWGGTWHRHVRPGLLNYRAKGWLPHQVLSWGVGHGNYPEETSGKNDATPRQSRPKVWEYMAMFIDKAIQTRLPAEGYPTDKPFSLRQPKVDEGYLIAPRAIENLLKIEPKPLVEKDGLYVVDYKANDAATDKPPIADNPSLPSLAIIKTADVPASERRAMYWVPDQELAEAWLKLHTKQP